MNNLLNVRSNRQTFCVVAMWLTGLIVSFYVLLAQPSRDGFELYFTLPLTWLICSVVFYEIVAYHVGGFGLKLFYAVTVARYLVLPVLTCMEGDVSSPYGFFSAGAYRYAIFIQDVELIVCCLVIRLSYRRTLEKVREANRSTGVWYDDISLGSVILIVASVLLILIRGVDRLTQSMRFGLITAKLDPDAYYGYDIWLAHAIMAFLVIIVIGSFQKRNDRRESLPNLFLPIVVTGLSFLFVFGNNRMMVVYYIVSGIATLRFAFPKKRKLFMLILIPAAAIVLFSFTMIKQYGIDVSSTSDITPTNAAETLAAYVTGTESIAKTFHMYELHGDQVQILTPLADFVNKTTIFQLPGLNKIIALFSDIPTTYQLGTVSSEIMPVAGQTLFLGGTVFGWLLDILAYAGIMRLLVYFDCKAKTATRTGSVYILTWISAILGMCMCYSIAVMFNGLTYVPFFVSIAILIGRNFRFFRVKRAASAVGESEGQLPE